MFTATREKAGSYEKFSESALNRDSVLSATSSGHKPPECRVLHKFPPCQSNLFESFRKVHGNNRAISSAYRCVRKYSTTAHGLGHFPDMRRGGDAVRVYQRDQLLDKFALGQIGPRRIDRRLNSWQAGSLHCGIWGMTCSTIAPWFRYRILCSRHQRFACKCNTLLLSSVTHIATVELDCITNAVKRRRRLREFST
jgi:hypothetical protein